ncbi:unnamed protein product [Rotaria magnacalcarata]|uniref:Uncharacterized protein n=2 Tax=Rotaria magnacalcarata TaxID=392030 RepID=A0A8S3A2A4_9BILA|nr:unnamed protein product [Rotaria magnacalcarata]
MSRSSNRMSDYLLSSAEHEGASLFPSGLLMYDLPSLRRTASRTSNNVELMNREPPKKRSPSPVPSVGYFEIISTAVCVVLKFLISIKFSCSTIEV